MLLSTSAIKFNLRRYSAAWNQPSAWEEFSLLTGETVHSLCPGKMVQVTVKAMKPPRDGGEGHVLAGAYTRSLLSSTRAFFLGQGVRVGVA